MSRTLVSTMTTALQAQGQEVFWLFQLRFSSGTARYTTAQHDIQWEGNPGASLGTDTFTEAADTNMVSHTPDTGITAWEHNTITDATDVVVLEATDVAEFKRTATVWVRSTNDVITTDYDYYMQAKVIRPAGDGSIEIGGVYGYADSSVTAANIVGEGFEVYMQRASASTGNLLYIERNSAGTSVSSGTLATSIAWAFNDPVYLDVDVRGLDVEVFYRLDPTDSWILAGSFTLTLDVRDATHLRAGIMGKSGTGGARMPIDEFTIASLPRVNTWTAIGGTLTLDAVEESPDRQTGVNLTLDGVDTSIIALALGANYIGRQATIYYGLMGTDGAIVLDPVQFGPYFMLSSWNARESRSPGGAATATIRTRLTSRLAPLAKIKGIVTNVRSHEKHYSSDVFFEHIPNLVGKKIIWGGQASGLGGGGTRGGGGDVEIESHGGFNG